MLLFIFIFYFSDLCYLIDMNKIGVSSKESSASALEDEHAVETWWNKPVHGRQASTYWSFALAAAVMGLVILGHRWQYERRQNHQLRLRLIAKEEVCSLISFFSSS